MSISFNETLTTSSARTSAINALCRRWHDEGTFSDVIGGRKWRDELYPVFKNPFGKREFVSLSVVVHYNTKGDSMGLTVFELKTEDPSSNYAFSIERSAAALFAFVTYGVHMTVYQLHEDPTSNDTVEGTRKQVNIWVPRRSRTKQTYVS